MRYHTAPAGRRKMPKRKYKYSSPNHGRPTKAAGPLRNMKLAKDTDEFLLAEKERTKRSGINGHDLTLVVECSLREFSKLKSSYRDQIYRKAKSG
jgi:hypothetical protein